MNPTDTTPDSAQPATSAPEAPTPETPIIARASRSYRRTRYFVGIVFFATGLLFAWDGWHAWPAKNIEISETEAALADAEAALDAAQGSEDEAAIRKLETNIRDLETKLEDLGEPKSDADLLIQKLFFLGLSPGAVLLIVNALYRSRGEIRFDGATITLPDHRQIPLSAIQSVDNRRWDKKGIAIFHYEADGGRKAKFVLDDFIYDRPPVDQIHEILTGHLGKTSPATALES